MSTPRPTMRHIAELAGVSVMTVSLALRNHARITQKTRTRIQEIATRIGYRPHPYVSALMANLKTFRHRHAGASATLAFIYHFPRSTLGSLMFMNSVYEGMRQCAGQLGFGLDVFYRNEAGLRTSH